MILSALLSFSLICSAQIDTSTSIIFDKVEVEASYPGGIDNWKKFLTNNLNPMVPVDNGAPVGVYTVFVQFIVNKDGKVTDPRALTNMGYGMEREVLRILQNSGDWVPAMQNGRKVNAYRKQPVTFMVTDESLSFSTYSLAEGRDNEITITADKVKDQDLSVTISRGTISSRGDGKYTINVKGTERLIVTLFDRKKKKEIGIASLTVNPAAK